MDLSGAVGATVLDGLYNQHIPQRALKQLSPIECLKNWYRERPELFNKRPYNLPGLDIDRCSG